MPHVVAALATSPSTADFNYFQLPALVAKASHGEWDEGFLVSALAAVAAAKGFANVAEAVLELTPDVADEFMTWFGSR